MDLRNNTIFGWALAGGIAIVGLSWISNSYFQPAHAEGEEHKWGYEVVAAEEEGGGDTGPSLNTLLASADPAAGEQVFKKCTQCHTINAGGANGVGPNLHGVMGEGVGKGHAGFAFSEALKGKGGNWDFATMNEWLKAPARFSPGTKMSFAGLSKPEDRANVMAYMNAQGSNLPIPAADAPAAEGAPADAAAAPADAKAGEAAPAAADSKAEAAPAADAKAGEAAPAAAEAPAKK